MTRRTALRGAAWTASAITIVVATPDIASASTGLEPAPSITVVPGQAARSSNDRNHQFVTWPLTITIGSAIPNLTVTFSGVSAVTDLTVTCDQGPWTGGGDSTRLYSTPLAAGDQLGITAVFARSSNGRDPMVVASFVAGTPPVNLGGCQSTIS